MSKQKYYSMRSFFSYLGRYKLRVVAVFISFVVSNALLAIIPVFIGKLVGSLSVTPIDSHQAYTYVWILIACSTGHDLVWRLSEFLYMKLLNPIGFKYETIAFRQIIKKPYPYFVDKFTGKVSSYVNTLGQEFRDFMEKIFWEYAGHAVNLVAISIILTSINWQTGVIFMGGIALMLLTGRYTIRNSTKYEKAWADVRSTKNGKIIDAVANFVNVKSFQKEDLETKNIEEEQAKTIRAATTSFAWNIVFWGSMSLFIRNMIWPATIAFNVYLFINHRISLADLTTLITALVLFTSYVWEIIWSVSQFSLRLARTQEAHYYLFGNVNIVEQYFNEKSQRQTVPTFENSLEFRNLSFAYPDKPEDNILSNINFKLESGKKIGIVGKSGSGKTTLTKLLLDYYPVVTGQILVDDTPIDTKDLASIISYVPQDTSLFHRSVADNIAYAVNRDVNRAEIVAAAKRAHADEFIAQISKGYDALVGERGIKLSAGQRQRIAIARAFLDDKPILVLDEATSALDSESEVLVQQALDALWQDKTVIAIAHRLSTLRHMDRIIVMDKGRVIESGTHDELLRQKGKYATLWAHQSGGFLDES